MLLCKKIRIEVNPQDSEALEFMQAKCRGLYNWWVMRLRNGERWYVNNAKKTLRESKQYDLELRYVYGKLLAEVYYRLDGASSAVCKQERHQDFPVSSRAISSLHSAIRRYTWKSKTRRSSFPQAGVAIGDRNATRISWHISLSSHLTTFMK